MKIAKISMSDIRVVECRISITEAELAISRISIIGE